MAQSTEPPEADRLNDFIEYWAAGRLLVSGGNPYSPDALLDIQRALGWPSPFPLIMWNPPWTLSFVLPFSLLEFSTGQFLWLLLCTALLLLSAGLLWQIYGGAEVNGRIPLLLALSFVPADIAVISGQVVPLLLVGITTFLYFEKRGSWTTAGASIALLSVKPHLLYLFWLALACWVVEHKRWRLLFAAGIACLGLAVIPWVMC